MNLIEILTLTAHAIGAPFASTEVAVLFAEELEEFSEAAVMAALKRCRRECRGRFALADVLDRLEAADGRPGPEEAWAMCPRSEAETVVWTAEISAAWGIARPVLESGDEVGARMAFRESYARLVSEARAAGQPVRWIPSIGHDPEQREQVLKLAVERNRLAAIQLIALAPPHQIEKAGQSIIDSVKLPALPAPESDAQITHSRLEMLRQKIAGDSPAAIQPASPAKRERKTHEQIEAERQRIANMLTDFERKAEEG